MKRKNQKKILITGVAKSGTTLLNNLMTAFPAYVIPDETPVDHFCSQEYNVNEEFIVAKRAFGSIFSHLISTSEIVHQWNMIKENDVTVIHIIRDGRDVVDSQYKSWGISNPIEWIECNALALKYSKVDDRIIILRYEDILRDPNNIMEQLDKLLNLFDPKKAITLFWSDYPSFVPEEYAREGKYKLRKLEMTPHTKTAWIGSGIDANYGRANLKKFGYE